MSDRDRTPSAADILEFAARCRSLVLATIAADETPLASYAPFVRDENGDLFVYVSELSAHTSNLRRGRCSALMIEDEASSPQIYARCRISFDCAVSLVEPTSADHARILSLLGERHGDVIDLLASLPDFHLMRLAPGSGTFVRGFGQAYRIDATFSRIEHIDADSLRRDRD